MTLTFPPPAGPAAGTASPAGGDTGRTRLRTLAAEFESMLIAQMLRGLKEAMTPDTDSGGLGAALLGDTLTTELSLAIGRSGGLGLSEIVTTALDRLDATAAPPAPGDGRPLAVRPATAAPADGAAHRDAAGDGASAGPLVTSAFGWRRDPFHGGPRFHAGTDIRAAYGQPVLAARDGVVTFAGEQPGYGVVVVVSHGHGLETRYAHLSSTAVQAGARVGSGDVIARAGASGRATAPHLHFEVRRHGAAVDPTRIDGLGPVVG